MWPFRKKRSNVVPLFGFVARMKAKDARLYESIRHLPVSMACRAWRSVHAEDFPQDRLFVYWPHAAS
jgi:hypothetical protein